MPQPFDRWGHVDLQPVARNGQVRTSGCCTGKGSPKAHTPCSRATPASTTMWACFAVDAPAPAPDLLSCSLEGSVAVVTGGTRGIGLACTVGLATLGATVVVVGPVHRDRRDRRRGPCRPGPGQSPTPMASGHSRPARPAGEARHAGVRRRGHDRPHGQDAAHQAAGVGPGAGDQPDRRLHGCVDIRPRDGCPAFRARGGPVGVPGTDKRSRVRRRPRALSHLEGWCERPRAQPGPRDRKRDAGRARRRWLPPGTAGRTAAVPVLPAQPLRALTASCGCARDGTDPTGLLWEDRTVVPWWAARDTEQPPLLPQNGLVPWLRGDHRLAGRLRQQTGTK